MTKEVRNIRRQKLPNGLTVITEQMQHIRSASIGIWLQTGSRDEEPEWNGISHFIEHMVFKGTKHRTDEDNPDYLVHEIFTQNFWKDHPLGKPILGTKETVKRFEREPILDAYAHRF